MKKLVFALSVSFLLASCGTYKAAYSDNDIYAELEINDSEYVVLHVRNNTDSAVQIFPDKSYYTNGTFNSVLIPNEKRYFIAGTTIPPVNVPPGRYISQEFVASKGVKFDDGKYDGISGWTPRSEDKLQNAYFDFECQVNGVVRHLVFNGPDIKKK